MPVYTISGRTTLVTATAAAPLAMLLKEITGNLARIDEIGITLATAVASTIGIARSTTATTTPVSIGAPTPMNNKDVAAVSISAISWTTVGAATGVPLRRATFPATIGSGVVWTFPEPLIVGDQVSAATGELLLINIVAATPGVFDYYVNWRE